MNFTSSGKCRSCSRARCACRSIRPAFAATLRRAFRPRTARPQTRHSLPVIQASPMGSARSDFSGKNGASESDAPRTRAEDRLADARGKDQRGSLRLGEEAAQPAKSFFDAVDGRGVGNAAGIPARRRLRREPRPHARVRAAASTPPCRSACPRVKCAEIFGNT